MRICGIVFAVTVASVAPAQVAPIADPSDVGALLTRISAAAGRNPAVAADSNALKDAGIARQDVETVREIAQRYQADATLIDRTLQRNVLNRMLDLMAEGQTSIPAPEELVAESKRRTDMLAANAMREITSRIGEDRFGRIQSYLDRPPPPLTSKRPKAVPRPARSK